MSRAVLVRTRLCPQARLSAICTSRLKDTIRMASSNPPKTNGHAKPPKLHGRAFYESLGSPKHILAPMVAQSEYAWRRLTRSFLTSKSDEGLISYSPMLHARMFADNPKYRDQHFQALKTCDAPSADATPYLDGHPKTDRPLFVQFCANEPDALLEAAKHVQAHCDAVDLNLGCPQGIAKRGHYGAFLQEDQPLIYRLINKLHLELDIPVTAKMRILDTREKTLDYAKLLLDAGASIITVHGRQRDQKGHKTGLADWAVLRYLRDNLPPETVMFANGNVLQHADLAACLEATGVDGVMSAEGNLYDPSIFGTAPPVGQEGREYFRTRDGRGGYRMDAVLRRYLHIIYTEVLGQAAPDRKPLFLPGDEMPSLPAQPSTGPDSESAQTPASHDPANPISDGPPPTKKQKRASAKLSSSNNTSNITSSKLSTSSPTSKLERVTSPNLTGMQAHLFNILRPCVAKHTHIRDLLARVRAGDMPAFERILAHLEVVTADALVAYASDPGAVERELGLDELEPPRNQAQAKPEQTGMGTNTQELGEQMDDIHADETRSSLRARIRCRRPWWVCQPYIRPLPEEALAKGAISLSKKDRRAIEEDVLARKTGAVADTDARMASMGNVTEGKELERVNTDIKTGLEKRDLGSERVEERGVDGDGRKVEKSSEGLVCG